MNTNLLLLLTIVAVVAWAIFIASKRAKVEVRCVKCQSKNVVEVDRRTLKTRTVSSPGSGLPGGGGLRLQIDYELTLHCKACEHRFYHKLTDKH